MRCAIGRRPYFDANAHELRSLETYPLAQTDHDKDPSINETRTLRGIKLWRARLSGWRGGLIACIAVVAFVLLLNLILAAVAATKWNPVQGIATAYTGDCGVAARWTTAIHLLINVLSSLLLGASNYTMQRLVAPTRGDIDKAHARKKWLDIGMPSIRNLSSISKGRLALWIMLGLSSAPLHLV